MAARYEGDLEIVTGTQYKSGRVTFLPSGMLEAYRDDALSLLINIPLRLSDGTHHLNYKGDYGATPALWELYLAGEAGKADSGEISLTLGNSGSAVHGSFKFKIDKNSKTYEGNFDIKRFG